MFSETVSYPAALLAGFFSFLSPCVLPLIPAYFTFITGFSIEQLTKQCNADIRKKVISSTIAYVMGFSSVFIMMGVSASFLGSLIIKYTDFIRIVGGFVIIIFGIHLTGLIRIPGLEFEKRIHFTQKPVHLLGTFFVGMAFGAGWSPCIGPLLGSILIIAGSQETVWHGTGLLATYSLGLAIPFIIISIFINTILMFIKNLVKTLKYINITAGAMLIVIGLFLVTNKLSILI